MPGADLDAALALGERIRATFAHAAAELDGRAVASTVSIGVAASRVGDLDGLLGRADSALYRAKQDGRDRVCAFAGVRGTIVERFPRAGGGVILLPAQQARPERGAEPDDRDQRRHVPRQRIEQRVARTVQQVERGRDAAGEHAGNGAAAARMRRRARAQRPQRAGEHRKRRARTR